MSSGRDAHGPRGCTGAGTGLRPSERTGEIGHTAAAGSSVAEIVTITDIVFRAESSGAGEATEEATGGVRSILMVAACGSSTLLGRLRNTSKCWRHWRLRRGLFRCQEPSGTQRV